MVEEIPVLVVNVPYVGLKDQYAPTGFTYAVNLHQYSKHLLLTLQVFQEVAHEGDINGIRWQKVKVVGGRGEYLYISIGISPRILIEVNSIFSSCSYVVDEFTVPSSDIEHNRVLRHESLKEVLTQDPPQSILPVNLYRVEAFLVQLGDSHVHVT